MHGHGLLHRLHFLSSPQDPTPVKRDSAPSSTCAPNDNSPACERPTSAMMTTTLPVVLGVVIPIVAAVIVLFFLHRRHIKKLRNEDANDKHKSLDFGMGVVESGGRRAHKGADMSMLEKLDSRRARGMSMDMGGSPYLLPPGLHNSRESLLSLSRTINGDNDKYRPAISVGLGDNTSLRSYRSHNKSGLDDSSSFTGSGRIPTDDSQRGLGRHIHMMPRSSPSPGCDRHSSPIPEIQLSNNQAQEPRKPEAENTVAQSLTPVGLSPNSQAHGLRKPGAESAIVQGPTPAGLSLNSQTYGLRKAETENVIVEGLAPAGLSTGSAHRGLTHLNHSSFESSDLRKSNNYLGALIESGNLSLPPDGQAQSDVAAHPPAGEELQAQGIAGKDSIQIGSNSPLQGHSSLQPEAFPAAAHSEGPRSLSVQIPRISLPPSETSGYSDGPERDGGFPVVNPPPLNEEIGQERITSPSAVEERQSSYNVGHGFDPRRLTMGIRPLPPEDPSDNPEQRANRIRSFYREYFEENKPGLEEDYGPEYYSEDIVYDSLIGDYVLGPSKPFAQPMGRRAMTPPPRAPPRFQGSPRHIVTNSSGGLVRPGPRAFSSVSGHLPGMRGPRKPPPTPEPLHVLPSPHLLKDDMSILPIDYAPVKTFKDQREGRPETPRGGLQPYTPARVHTPLVSSFDDLAVIPSPHALRKSGTFTSLDFALPPRFRNNDAGSDTGSIRSNRTGISAAHVRNIRAGAYRVSRLPADMVGTKDDIVSVLRPKWDIR